MTSNKHTKRALCASVLSVMLCAAMLVGSTFAWFTDSVTSGKNKIVAGNLDVELYHSNGNVTTETKVDVDTKLFVNADGTSINWEPGVMVYENFTVKNVGSLALKYKLTMNADTFNTVTVDGAVKSLKDVLKVAVLDEAFTGDRAAAQKLTFNKTLDEFTKEGNLAAGADDDTYAIVIYWEPSAADNDYNLSNGKESSDGEPLFVDLGVNLVATQDTVESDSFGNDYDADAAYPAGPWDGKTVDTSWYDPDSTAETYTLDTPEAVAGLAKLVNDGEEFPGKTIVLGENIDLNGKDWTPIGNGKRMLGSMVVGDRFKGTFDGNGKIISGLTIQNATESAAVGLFGVVDDGTVKNLKLEDVSINVPDCEQAGGVVGMLVNGGTVDSATVSGSVSSKNGAGGIAGRIIKNGSVTNCVNHASVGGNGYNKGGIVGAAYYNPENSGMIIADCVNNGTVSGTSGVGGIVGLSVAKVERCTNNAPITGNSTSVGGIVGEQQNTGSVTECTNSANIQNNANAFGTGGIVGWVRYNGADSTYTSKKIITVSKNRNSGDVTGGSSAGGIVGHVYNTALVEENVNTANSIKADTFAAGIVGSMQDAAKNAFQDALNIQVINNVSTTSITAIQVDGTCKDLYAYNNRPDDSVFVVENNRSAE